MSRLCSNNWMLSTTYPRRQPIFNSPNSPTSVYKALLMQGILVGTLLLSIIIPTVNGQHALQVYSGGQSLNYLHLLHARADLQTPLAKTLQPYECQPKPLSPQTWKELKLDEYIKTYPKALEINLDEFARQNNALNFVCGLNQFCSAGQLCSPISGRAWWVLAAMEQLTMYQNSLYTAIGLAASRAKAIGAELVNDLYLQNARKKYKLFQSTTMVLTMALAVVAIIAGVVFLVTPGLEAGAAVATAGAMIAIAQVTMLLKAQAAEREAGRQDTFTKWSHYENQISDWQEKSQSAISKRFKEIVENPIGSQKGILGSLAGGEFCRNSLKHDTNDLESKLARILTIRMVGQILRAKKGFITIGDGCRQNGPNGAFSIDDGWLSYCDKRDGTMMNVIYDDEGKSGNKFYNAKVLVEKYKITAEYITKQAFECFKLGKGPDYDPYSDGTTLPVDENSRCLINLPVCDTKAAGVRKKLKHHTTVKACRTAGGISLP
ncbi:uncharacterized protein PGTG_02059 [Puccinia graminis f. sp. tritici CRL 75-36-700-3]|uniref:DUF7872 domain-containing protein n=1 Tax=Puccinia graminis f. sp. tritici (strain CRL 75-36-700-3 / race SCCL) TaxID=418459 RepID=E3JX23_PUCGT|nr:uncharacterized protein PGTG_02059 [Puccinia graminis f. sp. tritici CRL 75-36-700-3]EFP76598.2 hypothetical protein PGTG_02059 [Puccinia graminis f. sp. tritici CRL 75-36-700-3]